MKTKLSFLAFCLLLLLPLYGCTNQDTNVANISLLGSGFNTSINKQKDKLILLSFGYTHCPDVCPTTLMHVAQTLELLSAEEVEKVTPIFITLDPERDSLNSLAKYVNYFHPDLLGVSIDSKYSAYFLKHFQVESFKDSNDKDYLINHTSFLYLVDDKAKIVDMMGHQTKPASIADAIRKKLKEKR